MLGGGERERTSIGPHLITKLIFENNEVELSILEEVKRSVLQYDNKKKTQKQSLAVEICIL